MTARGKPGKPKPGFTLSTVLGKLAKSASFPHSHSFDDCPIYRKD
jgi:hypothetical protein